MSQIDRILEAAFSHRAAQKKADMFLGEVSEAAMTGEPVPGYIRTNATQAVALEVEALNHLINVITPGVPVEDQPEPQNHPEPVLTNTQPGEMTLRRLHDTLSQIVREHQDVRAFEVYFDFCDFKPTDIDSWRGIYEQAAIGYTKEGKAPTCHDFYQTIYNSLGSIVTGYKGGEYQIDDDAPLWVANWGEVGYTRVVGVEVRSGFVILQTAYRET